MAPQCKLYIGLSKQFPTVGKLGVMGSKIKARQEKEGNIYKITPSMSPSSIAIATIPSVVAGSL